MLLVHIRDQIIEAFPATTQMKGMKPPIDKLPSKAMPGELFNASKIIARMIQRKISEC